MTLFLRSVTRLAQAFYLPESLTSCSPYKIEKQGNGALTAGIGEGVPDQYQR
jgi:hypothetical protein